MRKAICLLMLLPLCLSLEAQDFKGTWIMSYIKAKQPVFTMIQQDGELTLEDETPQDSTIIHSPGLMLIRAMGADSALSYSWDGAEKWSIEQKEGQYWFKGQVDSLYGNFDEEGRLVMSSTLDDVPTDYVFEPLKFQKSATKLDIENTRWSVTGDPSFLTGQQLIFQKDSVLTSELDGKAAFGEYYIHPIDNHFAVEFVVNLPATYIGIIYFNRISKRKMSGVFYAVTEDGIRPKKTRVTFKR